MIRAKRPTTDNLSVWYCTSKSNVLIYSLLRRQFWSNRGSSAPRRRSVPSCRVDPELEVHLDWEWLALVLLCALLPAAFLLLPLPILFLPPFLLVLMLLLVECSSSSLDVDVLRASCVVRRYVLRRRNRRGGTGRPKSVSDTNTNPSSQFLAAPQRSKF